MENTKVVTMGVISLTGLFLFTGASIFGTMLGISVMTKIVENVTNQ